MHRAARARAGAGALGGDGGRDDDVRVEGTRTFAAPRETVWEVLDSPERMARLIPGVESFDMHDDRRWRADVKIPLGIGGLKMRFEFTKLEERQPDFAKLEAKGNGVGAIVDLEATFDLADADAGATEMRWQADVTIGGQIGSMGRRVLQPVVNQQVENVLDALDEQVAAAAAKPG
jgi:carbon monoxide dehydrogenase subunit G